MRIVLTDIPLGLYSAVNVLFNGNKVGMSFITIFYAALAVLNSYICKKRSGVGALKYRNATEVIKNISIRDVVPMIAYLVSSYKS